VIGGLRLVEYRPGVSIGVFPKLRIRQYPSVAISPKETLVKPLCEASYGQERTRSRHKTTSAMLA